MAVYVDYTYMKKDGTITIDTIFRLYDGGDDFLTKIYCYLHEAQEANRTVIFENEGLTIPPGEVDEATNVRIMLYGVYPMIAETASKGMEMAKLN